MAYDLLLERFLRYVKINTRSDENATRTPTTQSQVDFALKVLKPELEELGLSNIHYLESNGYLVATLPANDDKLTSWTRQGKNAARWNSTFPKLR